MKRAGLTVEVPGDSSTAGTGTEGQAIDPSGPSNSAPSVSSARQRGRFSPGAYMQKAASVLGITSRTPSRASSKQGYIGGRASVNPIQRAANDATYRHSLELTEQNAAAVADFKKKKKSSKRLSQKELVGGLVRGRCGALWGLRKLARRWGSQSAAWIWAVGAAVLQPGLRQVPCRKPALLLTHLSAPLAYAAACYVCLLQLTQDEEVRYVRHNEGPVGEFETNKVVTSKYNVITFLPYFLFEMFSRAAYMYFLLQVRGA